MILQIIEWLLGSTGNKLLALIKQNSAVFNTVVLIYMLLLAIGHLQLMKIRRKTAELVFQAIEEIKSINGKLNPKTVYQKVLPLWQVKLNTWAKFIPHRLEFYLVPVSIANVQEKLNFSPDWIYSIAKNEFDR